MAKVGQKNPFHNPPTLHSSVSTGVTAVTAAGASPASCCICGTNKRFNSVRKQSTSSSQLNIGGNARPAVSPTHMGASPPAAACQAACRRAERMHTHVRMYAHVYVHMYVVCTYVYTWAHHRQQLHSRQHADARSRARRLQIITAGAAGRGQQGRSTRTA